MEPLRSLLNTYLKEDSAMSKPVTNTDNAASDEGDDGDGISSSSSSSISVKAMNDIIAVHEERANRHLEELKKVQEELARATRSQSVNEARKDVIVELTNERDRLRAALETQVEACRAMQRSLADIRVLHGVEIQRLQKELEDAKSTQSSASSPSGDGKDSNVVGGGGSSEEGSKIGRLGLMDDSDDKETDQDTVAVERREGEGQGGIIPADTKVSYSIFITLPSSSAHDIALYIITSLTLTFYP